MKNDTSTMELDREHVDAAQIELAQPAIELPTLDSIIRQICRDANHDSVRFVLRSDVGHDGE